MRHRSGLDVASFQAVEKARTCILVIACLLMCVWGVFVSGVGEWSSSTSFFLFFCLSVFYAFVLACYVFVRLYHFRIFFSHSVETSFRCTDDGNGFEDGGDGDDDDDGGDGIDGDDDGQGRVLARKALGGGFEKVHREMHRWRGLCWPLRTGMRFLQLFSRSAVGGVRVWLKKNSRRNT